MINVFNELFELFSQNSFFFLASIGIFSLFTGSLLNVVIYRLPIILNRTWEHECRLHLGLKPEKVSSEEHFSLWWPFSHCPHCKTILKPWFNVPLLSYLFLGGKCFNCGRAISLRYPIIELLTCLSGIGIAAHFGFSLQTLAALPFLYILIALIAIDLEYQILPDELTLLLLWLGLFINVFNIFTTPENAVIGAIIGYLLFYFTQKIFYFFTKKIGLGQGDFKLLAALGAWSGWQFIPFIILLSSILGIVFSITHITQNKHWRQLTIPFGPYLAIAGIISLCFGKAILLFYFNYLS